MTICGGGFRKGLKKGFVSVSVFEVVVFFGFVFVLPFEVSVLDFGLFARAGEKRSWNYITINHHRLATVASPS